MKENQIPQSNNQSEKKEGEPVLVGEEFMAELYHQRILIFMETEPQSNTYRQVLIDHDKYKLLSGLIGDKIGMSPLGLEIREVEMSTKTYKLPDLFSYKI